MTFLLDVIKGIFIGVANIIPGVSGGTMAVSLGIYDKLIASLSGFTKDWKKSVKTLLPIVLGCAIGLIAFAYVIEYLLSRHTFLTCMTFIGLILGGLPVLIRSLKKKLTDKKRKLSFGNFVSFLIFFGIVILLPMMKGQADPLAVLTVTPVTLLILFFVGIIASATMVIPGVSGSMVMMILGYYYGIINTLKGFFDALKAFDINGVLSASIVLVPFGIGVLLGIFLIAKAIDYLFKKHSIITYCSILGLIFASPFAIIYNTGMWKQLSSLSVTSVIAGFFLCGISGVITYFLGGKEG